MRSQNALIVVGAALFLLLAARQQLNADLLATPADEFSPVGPLLNAVPVLVLVAWTVVRRRRAVRHGAAHRN